MDKRNLVIKVLLLIILCLVLYNIWSKPKPVVSDYENKINQLEIQITKYETAVNNLAVKADSLNKVVSVLETKNDSLEHVKQQVKHIYHEVYTNIHTANSTELDSIIRANW